MHKICSDYYTYLVISTFKLYQGSQVNNAYFFLNNLLILILVVEHQMDGPDGPGLLLVTKQQTAQYILNFFSWANWGGLF